MRGVGVNAADMPEWKRYITGGAKASYGKKEKKSLLEQRQGLPIYKLKDELIKVRLVLVIMNSKKLVIPLHSLYWSIHTKDESKRGTAFAFIFGVN